MARAAARASALGGVGVCGYLLGVALPVSPAFDLPLAFLVLLSTLAAVAGPKQLDRGRSRVLIPVAGFVAARLVSVLAAPDPLGHLQVLAPLLPALLLFFVLAEWVQARHVVAVCASLTAAGFVLAATLLSASWLSETPDAEAWAQAVPSPLVVVRNDLAVVGVVAPLALALASLRPHRLVRVAVVGYFTALVAVIAVVRSRTALVTTVVAIVAFTVLAGGWRSSRRARVGSMLAGLGVLVAALAVDALIGSRLVHKLVGEWQGSGRLALWVAALAMFRDAPFLGHGPHSYVLHYRAYLDALQLPSWIEVDPRLTPWAHNLYLELLAEQGVIGLAAFLALGATGLSMVKRMRAGPRGDLHRLGAAAGAAFIAFLAAAVLELSFIRAWVTIVLFTLLGLLTTLTRSAMESEPCKAP